MGEKCQCHFILSTFCPVAHQNCANKNQIHSLLCCYCRILMIIIALKAFDIIFLTPLHGIMRKIHVRSMTDVAVIELKMTSYDSYTCVYFHLYVHVVFVMKWALMYNAYSADTYIFCRLNSIVIHNMKTKAYVWRKIVLHSKQYIYTILSHVNNRLHCFVLGQRVTLRRTKLVQLS